MNKKIIVGLFVMGSALNAHATSFNCFSNYYTANSERVDVSGNIVSSDKILNLKATDHYKLLEVSQTSFEASANFKTNKEKYKAYNQFFLSSKVDLLLPKNLSQISGKFTGYLSDALADSDGSNGRYPLVCNINR